VWSLAWWLAVSRRGAAAFFYGRHSRPWHFSPAYVIEKLLGWDNVFVFLVVFGLSPLKDEHNKVWVLDMGAGFGAARMIAAGAALNCTFSAGDRTSAAR